MSSRSSPMVELTTPEMLWHGGYAKPDAPMDENAKPEPVYSIDMLGANLVVTSGVDENMPPKGSARLWRLTEARVCFLIEFNDHQSVVNAARFSPCGKMLATASDRLIIVYEVSSPSKWHEISEHGVGYEKHWYSHLDLAEIYDLQWSCDSSYLVAGAINSKAQTVRVRTKETTTLAGHTSYVQGVAWDPLGKYVVTQSADRSVKLHQFKLNDKGALRLTSQGNATLRTMSALDSNTTGDLGAMDVAEAAKPKSLYADSSAVACFFRRPSFTPNGALLIAPTGLLKESALRAHGLDRAGGIFATHIYHRAELSTPVASLTCEEPSVVVRCCPRLYEPLEQPDGITAEGFPCAYRTVFAVATTSSVLVYDTQHISAPVLKISNIHLASINDLAWSADGLLLLACSTDGYVTIMRFAEDAFGKQLSIAATPERVHRTFPFVYGYTHATSREPDALKKTTIVGVSPTGVESVLDSSAVDTKIICASDVPEEASIAGAANVSEAVTEGVEAPKKKKRIAPTTTQLA